MKSKEIRTKFLEFFEERGHTVVPSSPLVPDDPSVLLTSAGMQQFKPYYTGDIDPFTDAHPTLNKPLGSKNATSIQKSFRTSDIDEVGDTTHLTFFEMLGNFSFGGYFKKEAIEYAFDFITKVVELPISYISVFHGSDAVPKDEESIAIWKKLGVPDVREEGMEEVFWGPTGREGPCGPTTEIYCRSIAGEDVEVWNIVFNEFFYPGSREELLAGTPGKVLRPLATPGVDTGMGMERLAMIAQEKRNIFETDLFAPVIEKLPVGMDTRTKRIVADHVRGIAFLISDGVRPSNKGAGYILRRLMRRVIVHEHLASVGSFEGEEVLGLGGGVDVENWLKFIVREYKNPYPELDEATVVSVFKEENSKFQKSFIKGLRKLGKLDAVDAQSAFKLYESFGLPYEVIKEVAEEKAGALAREEFDKQFEKHQKISRAGQERKFGGHGLILDTGELKAADEGELKTVMRLHTATHLLQAALREVLGPSVQQAGSDINVKRTRFDFTFDRRLTDEEVKQVEKVVNEKIREDLPMQCKELPKVEAEKTGALYFFKEKYPDPVKVYFTGPTLEDAWSKEFCGGPHVAHTGELGKFRIVKQKSIGAGVRRIRGVLDG